MDLKEIITRKTGAVYYEEELCFVVQEYIFRKKGVRVGINIYKGVDMSNPWTPQIILNQFSQLMSAFETACWELNKEKL